MSYSAKVLCDHLGMFVNLTDETESYEVAKVESDTSLNKMADMPIEELELSVRSYNCLKRANINTILLLYTSVGTKNALNVRNATMEGLSQLMDAETVAKLRSKAVEEIPVSYTHLDVYKRQSHITVVLNEKK